MNRSQTRGTPLWIETAEFSVKPEGLPKFTSIIDDTQNQDQTSLKQLAKIVATTSQTPPNDAANPQCGKLADQSDNKKVLPKGGVRLAGRLALRYGCTLSV